MMDLFGGLTPVGALYVKTTRKNYLINLIVTSFSLIFFGYGCYLIDISSQILWIIFSILPTFATFRLMEYLLTKKHIWRGMGPIVRGWEAIYSVILDLVIIGVMFYYIWGQIIGLK